MDVKVIFLLGCFFSSFGWAKTPLVLLSIDGFAQHYIKQYQPKTLMSLIEQGTSAKALLPVYPSKTFPNHLSIITGQYPINHGIVHNVFFDRAINKTYSLGDGKNEASWLTGYPLWYINELQGNKSAVYFWPESETTINTKLATYYYPYKHSTPNEARIEKILTWLRLPEDQRPNFIAGYFSTVDDAGHSYGAESRELVTAINNIDNLLADFIQVINKEFYGNVNLVIVSDHGMTKVDEDHIISWQKNIVEGVKAVNGSTQLYLYSDDATSLKHSVNLFKRDMEKNSAVQYQIYQYPHFPKHWHFNQETTATPNVIIEATPSYVFNRGETAVSPESHGYDPKYQRELDAIFIATGPAFYKNLKIEAFENIHILPILTRALKLEDVKDIDGNYQIADKIVK